VEERERARSDAFAFHDDDASPLQIVLDRRQVGRQPTCRLLWPSLAAVTNATIDRDGRLPASGVSRPMDTLLSASPLIDSKGKPDTGRAE
jgi:hypothetical protein